MSSSRIPVPKYALPKFAFLCAWIVVFCQILYAIAFVRLYWRPDSFASPPLQLDRGGRVVHLESNASGGGGIRIGDTLLQVAGQTISGMETVRQKVKRILPGTSIILRVRHKDGSESTLTVLTRSVREDLRGLGGWLIPAIAFIVTPTLALALGFLVVFIRPHDRSAWLIFGLMIALSQLLHFPAVETYLPPLIIRVRHVAGSSLGLWIALLAVSFPVPLKLDGKRRLLKLLYTAVFLSLMTSIAVIRFVSDGQFLSPPIQTLLVSLQGLLNLLSLLSVVCLSARWLTLFLLSDSLDVRRRLRILAAGSLLSFSPISMLVLAELVTRHDPLTSAPRWATTFAILSLDLFPATLAYAVIVRKALDLSELLRISVQYALARRGLLALRFLSLATLISYLVLRNQSVDTGLMDRPWFFLGVALLLILELAMTEHARSWLDRKFFQDAYKVEQVIASLRERQFTTAEELSNAVLGLLGLNMHVMSGAVFLPSEDLFTPVACIGIPVQQLHGISTCHQTIRELTAADAPLHVDWQRSDSWIQKLASEDLEVLQSLRAEVVAPIMRAGHLSGILVLAIKKSQSAYVSRDLELLKVITAQMAIVLENVALLNKVTAEAIERTRRDAEARAAVEASKSKSLFIAQLSHELRTPVNAIINYSELLQEEAADEGQHWILPDLVKISIAGKNLLKLIGSVLDVTKLEAGKMQLHLEHFPLGELITECLALAEPLVKKNSNFLVAEMPPEPGNMFADSAKLKQSLLNLLSNAAKFTERGTVKLQLESFSAEDADWVRLQVIDTGIGMTAQQVSRLFVPFVQAEKTTSKNFGGTGLGLAISRDFCRMMGGDVTLSSELGKGTRCVIELPRKAEDVQE